MKLGVYGMTFGWRWRAHCLAGLNFVPIWLHYRGFESRQGLGIFQFTTASRPALGPSQPPLQWVPGALSLGVKRPTHESDHSPLSSAEVKNAWSCTSAPNTPSWRGAQLKKKHTDNFTLLYVIPLVKRS